MNFTVYDKIKGAQHFELEVDATIALTEARQAFLNQENYRFSIARVIVEDTNTTWRNMEDVDPEESTYKVFNQKTGLHEDFTTKSSALLRLAQLKEEFLTDVMLDKVYKYVPPELPKSIIPVEIL